MMHSVTSAVRQNPEVSSNVIPVTMRSRNTHRACHNMCCWKAKPKTTMTPHSTYVDALQPLPFVGCDAVQHSHHVSRDRQCYQFGMKFCLDVCVFGLLDNLEKTICPKATVAQVPNFSGPLAVAPVQEMWVVLHGPPKLHSPSKTDVLQQVSRYFPSGLSSLV